MEEEYEMYDAMSYYIRANRQARNNNEIGAIEDYTTAIELDPAYFSAYYMRGNAKRNIGDYAGALGDYNKALEINPNYSNASISKKELIRKSRA